MDLIRAANYGIIGCWLILFGYWARAALRTKAAAEKTSLGSRVLIRVMVIGAYGLVIGGWFDLPVAGRELLSSSFFLAAAGMTVTAAGLALAVWARRTLADNWSGSISFKQDHELIQGGPYARVRHPIYSGLLLMFLGAWMGAFKLGSLMGLGLAAVAFLLKIRQEEALMRGHFPEQYAEYQRSTHRLIPGVF